MLTEESNRAFTQVGPGTLMGELLRRYWMPIAAIAELDDTPVKPVRLLGEDLVLYKDGSGQCGLVVFLGPCGQPVPGVNPPAVVALHDECGVCPTW